MHAFNVEFIVHLSAYFWLTCLTINNCPTPIADRTCLVDFVQSLAIMLLKDHAMSGLKPVTVHALA